MHQIVVVSEIDLVRDCFVRVLNQYADLCATPGVATANDIDAKLETKEQRLLLWVACDRTIAEAEITKLRSARVAILLCLMQNRAIPTAQPSSWLLLQGDTSVEELRATIHRQAALGTPAMTSNIASIQRSSQPDEFASLTRREREVVRLVAHGMSNKEIAGALHVSVYTAKNHVQRLLAKLELHSRSALVARYVHALNARSALSGGAATGPLASSG